MSIRPPFRRDCDSPQPGEPPQDFQPPMLPRYQVVLHRTTDKGLLFVVDVLRRLTHFAEAEAMARMWQSYHNDRALILVTHLERAELYQEQFAGYGLRSSIEPAA